MRSVSRTQSTLIVGGLGWPHDQLLVAALRAMGLPARAIGAMNVEALERGRAALHRGQCAPMLYTAGALIRSVRDHDAGNHDARGGSLSVLNIQSCGPCRFALFSRGYAHALERLGLPAVETMALGQSVESFFETFSRFSPDANAGRVIDALVAADVLTECAHRLRPHENERGEIDAEVRIASQRMAEQIEAGEAPVMALADVSDWHEGLWTVRPQALARAVIVGEPWSLHVDGDGQLNLPRLLARAGVEVDIAPFGTWAAYLAWQARQARFGGGTAASPDRGLVKAFEANLDESYRRASAAAGLSGFSLPDIDQLTELASPYLTPAIRGGYGHLEIGLAIAAKRERRAHFVVSVKSFGCIPSAGISDAILPTALGDLPYLSLEVCADGEAARESRLAMRIAAALDAAEREFERAQSETKATATGPRSPMTTNGGQRRVACTLANEMLTRSAASPLESAARTGR